jgi:hypothetical protein
MAARSCRRAQGPPPLARRRHTRLSPTRERRGLTLKTVLHIGFKKNSDVSRLHGHTGLIDGKFRARMGKMGQASRVSSLAIGGRLPHSLSVTQCPVFAVAGPH